jgi:hypothetical protein
MVFDLHSTWAASLLGSSSREAVHELSLLRAKPPKGGDAEPRGYRGPLPPLLAGPPANESLAVFFVLWLPPVLRYMPEAPYGSQFFQEGTMRRYRHSWTSLAATTCALVAAALAACEVAVGPSSIVPSSIVPAFAFGNGAPRGAHYNLNIIGVPRNKPADMTGNSGHRIFVPLSGTTRILLCESGAGGECLSVEGFQVLDANGTDGTAKFALPDPDPDADGTSVYSVYVRALGTPGGHATNTTCGMGAGLDGVFGTADDEQICSVIQLTLGRTKGKSTFENVSRELLYVYADVNGDGTLDRVPLFSDALVGYFWEYDNQGLKLAQLRFYPCSTTVPLDPGASISTSCS